MRFWATINIFKLLFFQYTVVTEGRSLQDLMAEKIGTFLPVLYIVEAIFLVA